MTVHVCCLLAILLNTPETTVTRVAIPERVEPGLLISRNDAIADLDRVCVHLVAHAAPDSVTEGLVEKVAEKVRVAGIEHVECKTGVTPRLHIHIETVGLEACGQTVYRVQTALSRIVTFTDHREVRVQADVWRVKPVMQAVENDTLAAAVIEAALTQAEAFAGACQAAKHLHHAAQANP